jgi:hypothetical protein
MHHRTCHAARLARDQSPLALDHVTQTPQPGQQHARAFVALHMDAVDVVPDDALLLRDVFDV